MNWRNKAVRVCPGLSLDYVEQGDPNGTPLVLLHGYTDSWRSFEPLLRALPKSVRAIAFSQRGHGDSDKPLSSYNIAALASDAAAVLETLGIDHAVVAGHCMGSRVAQRLALERPQQVAGLVLIGAFRTLQGNAGAQALWHDAVAAMADPVDPAFVSAFQKGTLAGPVPQSFLDTVIAESLKVPARIWRELLAGMVKGDRGDDIGRIRVPTLILWGDQDSLCGREEQSGLAAAIPGSRLLVYADAGHAPHWEEPERAAADIAAFITGLAGSPSESLMLLRRINSAA
jgi:non-heme chloroperoxidase